MITRGIAHDLSKLYDDESWSFAENREDFRNTDYGTPEYEALVKKIQPAIDKHYEKNRHHTEHYPNGYKDMNLIDILEMLADWHAASSRSGGLSEEEGLVIAFEKYGISEEIQQFILNTYIALGWLDV